MGVNMDVGLSNWWCSILDVRALVAKQVGKKTQTLESQMLHVWNTYQHLDDF
jgi:hypothetical protein